MSSRLQAEEHIAPVSMATHFENNVSYLAPLLLFVLVLYGMNKQSKLSVPVINPKKPMELSHLNSSNRFMTESRVVMRKGRSIYPHELYKVYSDWGEALVLPPEFVNELKSHPDLDFLETAKDDSHGYVPGFEPFNPNHGLVSLVTKHLTKALTKVTAPLSREATVALRQDLTDLTEWHEIIPSRDVLGLISRLSSRVFMGEDLCRDEEWIKATTEYTVASFTTGDKLRVWPRLLRPLVHWFIPDVKDVRNKLDAARRAIRPLLERRKAEKAEALARGETPPVHDDSLEWFEQQYSPGYDPAVESIALSLVAIHTTSDLLQIAMFSLARHQELFAPLREEVVRVLGSQGLTKQALQDLKLMDSVIKEAQRIKPILLSTWRRRAEKNIKLSSGYLIPKGTRIIISTAHMQEAEYYEEPEKFDGYRFLRMRGDPEKAKMAHLVSTSEYHLGFGHGQHSCPGRFFAANELKIALCHLLLKYDWKLPEGHDPDTIAIGMTLILEPGAKLLVRRRQEELDLDSLVS
ncbi:cytochrome P450 [Diaporthe helianthi]|uniref:Cytochrome P450 n=1 Tax=Diaporthe helianthi TaxID=158607 RepID=A0A2P5HFH3_DIAHE|nr:cytochrome P450 [Diaporthe helianthi]